MQSEIETQNHIIWKLTDFFADQRRYKTPMQEYSDSLKDKTDIELQCLGYGLFKPDQAFENFWKYLLNILSQCQSIKSLKIVLNGFSLRQMNQFTNLFEVINKLKALPKIIWIHTSHLTQCTIQDFQKLLRIAFDFSHRNQANLEEISIQFNNWSFLKGPLLFEKIKKIFIQINDSHQNEMSQLLYKKYRIEMSGWYYNIWEAKKFLNFVDKQDVKKIIKQKNLKGNQIEQQIEKLNQQGLNLEQGNVYDKQAFSQEVAKFHNDMVQIIQKLLEGLKQVQDFQIDFRGWNEILQMKQLKKKLDNIKKPGRSDGSIIKRKALQQQQNQQKELRMYFLM